MRTPLVWWLSWATHTQVRVRVGQAVLKLVATEVVVMQGGCSYQSCNTALPVPQSHNEIVWPRYLHQHNISPPTCVVICAGNLDNVKAISEVCGEWSHSSSVQPVANLTTVVACRHYPHGTYLQTSCARRRAWTSTSIVSEV
jgi:hypothetical protein